jgi:hypothetical protein
MKNFLIHRVNAASVVKNLKFTLLSTLVLIASIGSLQAGSTPTRITAPQIITVPGSYVLANDITGTSGGAAIEIQASDVTLNLNGHTITANQGDGVIIDQFVGNNTNNLTLVNVHVSNGQIVAGNLGVGIFGSSCLVNGLNITVGTGGIPIEMEHGNFNRVHSCVLNGPSGQPVGNNARAAFALFLTSHNTIQNNTLAGVYIDTIQEDDQAGASFTVVGDNTFSGNQFASPTP